MVPKIHAKGKSFRGAAAYLLHDKDRASTSERVGWTETINLMTANPQTAWRVMAATAMKQDELKADAGVDVRGRKSIDSVLHVTLAWHPDQKDIANQAEMMRAAMGAMGALKAQDHQALVICHKDERQPHIHVLINRVHPETGRMLSSSKEKLFLSKWAEAYEKEQGHVYCEQRVLNNDARSRKKYTRGKKDKARHIHEALEKTKPTEQAKAEERAKDAELAEQARAAKQQQQDKWKALQTDHKSRIAEIRSTAANETLRAKEAIREQYRPQYQTLYRDHQQRLSDFIRKEKTVLGRVHNAFKAFDISAIIRGERTEGQERRRVLGEAFNLLSSAGARKQAIERSYEKAKRSIELQENRDERKVARNVRADRDEKLAQARTQYIEDRVALRTAQQRDGVTISRQWRTRSKDRIEAWERNKSLPTGKALDRDQQLAERLRLIEQFRERQKNQSKDRTQDRDRD